MNPPASVTLFHNPACGTSRTVLGMIREAGVEPRIVDYVKTGWDRGELQLLLAKMGVGPRDVLRVRGTPAEELGLTDPAVSDDRLLNAMAEHPILVERPIVETATAARLCRPAERLAELLQS